MSPSSRNRGKAAREEGRGHCKERKVCRARGSLNPFRWVKRMRVRRQRQQPLLSAPSHPSRPPLPHPTPPSPHHLPLRVSFRVSETLSHSIFLSLPFLRTGCTHKGIRPYSSPTRRFKYSNSAHSNIRFKHSIWHASSCTPKGNDNGSHTATRPH